MTINEYKEILILWLQMKRDMPWNNEPEPRVQCFIQSQGFVSDVSSSVREEVMRDFYRPVEN